jgi:hypothetical protein
LLFHVFPLQVMSIPYGMLESNLILQLLPGFIEVDNI